VSSIDVRSDFPDRQLTGGIVTTENFDIVANKADWTGSRAMAVSSSTLKFGSN